MAATPHGSCAKLAEAHLRASGFTNEGVGGNSGKIGEQAECLAQWAKQQNRLLDKTIVDGLKKHTHASAEHEVYYDAQKNRAVKLTLAGSYGVTPDQKGTQVAANPLCYLARLNLMIDVFGSEIEMLGVIMAKSMILFEPERPRIAIVQPWITGRSPTEEEIKDFMESLGFESIPASYFGWRRNEDKITVYDARPDNFVLYAKGVVPIDLVVGNSN